MDILSRIWIGILVSVMMIGISAKTGAEYFSSKYQAEVGKNVGVQTEAIYNAVVNYISKNGTAPSSMADLTNNGFLPSTATSNGDGGTYSFVVDQTLGTVAISTTFSTQAIMQSHLANYKNSIKPVNTTGNTVVTTYVLPSSVGQFFLQAYTGPTAPSSSQYSRWYDTSGSTVVLKLYDSASGTWKATSTTTASSVGTIYSSPTALYSTVGTSGEIRYAYDTTSNALQSYTYYNGAWYLSSTTTGGGVKTITLSGGTRTWSDGSYATSCKNYITPPSSSYTYAGDTGSGIYRIDPDGSGSIPAFNAYCDMTTDGGGYTFPKHNITTLYTGNGSTQSVNTGVDMATQWGSSSSEKYGGLVWIKSRSNGQSHNLYDTIRGGAYALYSDLTAANTATGSTAAFGSSGITLGSYSNSNSATYASWNFQTTHTISGTTNHGKSYVIHYNPWSGFMIAYYTGSGTAGHQIPNPLGRKLGFVTVKNLSSAVDWASSRADGLYVSLNTTTVESTQSTVFQTLSDSATTLGANGGVNTSGSNYILYGFANSFYDSTGGLIGDYEIGTYTGSGATGNKVTTKSKPAWIMIKRLNASGNWIVADNKRGDILTYQAGENLFPNTSTTTNTTVDRNIQVDSGGIILNYSNLVGRDDINALGGTYLYIVGYEPHK